MMNTAKRDRNILKRLVESYGVKDVEKYVNYLNEEEQLGLENKDKIISSCYNQICEVIKQTSISSIYKDYYKDALQALGKDNYKNWIVEKVLSPLYDAGVEAYSKMDSMPDFKTYTRQIVKGYMNKFAKLLNLPNDNDLLDSLAFYTAFSRIFKLAMSEAKNDIAQRKIQAEEDADIQAGLTAKPGDFEDFDSAAQGRDLLVSINNRGQKLQEARYSHVVKATEEYVTVKTDLAEVEYISLRADGAIFFKTNDGGTRCFKLSPKALMYLQMKDAESANLMASWCKTFIKHGRYIDPEIDVTNYKTWIKN